MENPPPPCIEQPDTSKKQKSCWLVTFKHKIIYNSLFQFIFGICLILFSIWAFFYNFHIFPWTMTKWWHFPETITVLAILLIPFIYGCVFIEESGIFE